MVGLREIGFFARFLWAWGGCGCPRLIF